MKKYLALLLVFCTLFLLLTGCKGKKEEKATDPQGTEADGTGELGTDEFGQQEFDSAVPVNELDFEGKEIVILCPAGERLHREFKKETYDTSNDLDVAINTRNEKVCNDLNMNIRLVKEAVSDYDAFVDKITAMITNDVDNGFHEYDIVADVDYPAMRTVLRDYKANAYDSDLFPYFDFSKPCWNQTIISNTLMNNKLYGFVGDMNLSAFDSAFVIWQNKSLYDKKKTDDDPEDIQQLVFDGEWTYDILYDWARLFEDSNPATECGDTYGYLNGAPLDYAAPQAWDVELLTTNNDGTHSFNIIGNTKAEDALAKVRNLMRAEGTYGSKYFGSNNMNRCDCSKENYLAHFASGTVVFMCSQIYSGEVNNQLIREMEDKYALLPLPKYDDNQADYATTCYSYNMLSIVNHHETSDKPIDGVLVCSYLQYANEQSYTNVRGYYFKRIIEPKFLGTDDSDGMVSRSIEIFYQIIDSIRFDIWQIYSPALNDIGWLWKDNIQYNGGRNTLEASFRENSMSGPGAPKRTEAQYNEALANFDSWIFS